jgi:sugar phosphate isomerase/epimerase
MSTTRTGNFTIGFRRGWSDWQKDLGNVIAWAKENNFGAIDLGKDNPETVKQVLDAGLKVGTLDLQEWNTMLSPDAGKRKEAIAKNSEQIKAMAPLGSFNYFVVMLPEKAELSRKENFGYMVESFSELAPVLEAAKARIVVEGWPGPGALVCTPEGYRAFFEQVPSQSMAVNYDPSHLIRMGIDPLRYLREFASRVAHVHGKDTELLSDGLYEYGHEQSPTFGQVPGFGGTSWRYTIPGHGVMRWVEAFGILKNAGYNGAVCIELEDANFNGTDEGEKQGLIAGQQFLQSC